MISFILYNQMLNYHIAFFLFPLSFQDWKDVQTITPI